MVESSCWGCTQRTVGCHTNCEKYKKFREQLDTIHQAKIKYCEDRLRPTKNIKPKRQR